MNTSYRSIFFVLLIIGIQKFSFAQDCEPYFPMEEGTTFEQTNYNHKGKIDSRSEQKIISKETNGGDLTAKVEGVLYDKKDKKLNNINYTLKCEGGQFMVDMGSVVPSDSWDQYQGMTVEMDGDFLELPSDPTVGDKLEDANMTVKVTNAGVTMVTIKVEITNRTVEKKEEVTTDAGTFDCVLFSYDVYTEVGGIIPIKARASSKDWYAKNAGLVKQETYDKKGKLTGYSLLTKLTRP